MQTRAIAVLAALCAALVGVWYLQKGQKARAERPEEHLFAEVDARDVHRLEVDHLERAIQVVLERDRAGRWSMTAPVPYPAEVGVVQNLLEIVCRTRGIPVDDPDLEALGLDPPRIVVEFAAGDRGGRVEIGGDDVDGVRLFARVPGEAGARVLCVSKKLFTSLDLNPHDYRDRRATPFDGRDVITLRRTGSMVLAEGGGAVDLTFDALLDPVAGWTSTTPAVATLDPVQMGFIVRGAAELRVDGFESDAPGALAAYGLAEPRLRVELESERGETVALRFGCREQGDVRVEDPKRWYCCREGYPFVWTVDLRTVGLLSAPRQELYDRLFLRTLRESVERVELTRGGETLALARDGDAWSVSSGDAVYAADAGAVQDLFSGLEFAQVSSFDESVAWPETGDVLSIAVVERSGRRIGGELAPDGDGAWFRRFGDALVGRVDGALVELSRTPLDRLRSRVVNVVDDLAVHGLTLGTASGERRFLRDAENALWRPEGETAEVSHAFYSVLERLEQLGAVRWLDGEGAELADEVRVVFRGTFGERRLTLGRAGGLVECRADGARAEVDPALLEDLLALLQ